MTTGETIYNKCISLWRMEESSGQRLDEIGHNDLNVVNDTGRQPGIYQYACNFTTYVSELGGYEHTRLEISDADAEGLEPASFSFFMNVKMDVPWTTNYLVSRRDTSTTSWAVRAQAGKLQFCTSSDGSTFDILEADLPTIGVWHIIGVSYDATTRGKTITVDGLTVGSSGAFHDSLLYNSSLPFTIGGIADDGFGIDGIVDEMAFSDHVFTSDDWIYLGTYRFVLPPTTPFRMPDEDEMCNVRTITELSDQIKRFVPIVMKTSKAQEAFKIYRALSYVFQMDEEESCALFKEVFLEYSTGDFLDLHGLDYGKPRFEGETDTVYRARLRSIDDKLTKPVIEDGVNNLLEVGECLIREPLMDGIFCDDNAYFDRLYYWFDDPRRIFIVVVPPQIDAEGSDFFDNRSYFNNHSFWGSGGPESEIYDQVWDLIETLRAAGVSAILQIEEIP